MRIVECASSSSYLRHNFSAVISSLGIFSFWGLSGYLLNDFGGETYGGITRNYNPDWKGWPEIDTVRERFIKQYRLKYPRAKKFKWCPLQNNHYIDGAEMYVKEFYREWWNSWGLESIKDSLAAVHTFDFAIGGSYSVMVIQKTVNDLGSKQFEVDGQLTEELCTAVNNFDPVVYLEKLRINRIAFYTGCANKWHKVWHKGGTFTWEQTQKHFLPGWLYRANKIRPILKDVIAKRTAKAASRQPV